MIMQKIKQVIFILILIMTCFLSFPESANAFFSNDTLVIDGLIDKAWEKTNRYQAKQIIQNSQSGNELSAWFSFLYDHQNLYFLLEINDDTVFHEKTVTHFLKNDLIKLSFRINHKESRYIFIPNQSSIYLGKGNRRNIIHAWTNTRTGYRLEVKIPTFNLGIRTLDSGKKIDFNLTINDVDQLNETKGKQLAWSQQKNAYGNLFTCSDFIYLQRETNMDQVSNANQMFELTYHDLEIGSYYLWIKSPALISNKKNFYCSFGHHDNQWENMTHFKNSSWKKIDYPFSFMKQSDQKLKLKFKNLSSFVESILLTNDKDLNPEQLEKFNNNTFSSSQIKQIDHSGSGQEMKILNSSNEYEQQEPDQLKNTAERMNHFSISASQDTIINYQDLNLKIPAGFVPETAQAKVKVLTIEELEPIPNEMTNITRINDSDHFYGYSITVNNDEQFRFNQPIEMTLSYNEDKIPAGLNEDQIFVYYFDQKSSNWLRFERAYLDKKNNRITCVTDHFCQFYVGMMNIQSEPPQAKGINTKPINVEEIDPLIGIKAISPPQVNHKGTADLFYPLEIPKGINDFSPSPVINYSSDIQYGNCGTGWNLSVSSIDIDTRKNGVARYDNCDDYMLDGEKLIHIGNHIYRSKVEKEFKKIVKNNDDSFTVYYKDGTKAFYGLDENSRLTHPKNNTYIYKWYLTKLEDKFGNSILYTYQSVSENGIKINLYPEKISYGYEQSYSINFAWGSRPDKRTHLAGGFLIKNLYKLDSIIVKYKQNVLKKYELNYHFDHNIKTYLKSILEKDASDQILNHHSFAYNNENQYQALADQTLKLFQDETIWIEETIAPVTASNNFYYWYQSIRGSQTENVYSLLGDGNYHFSKSSSSTQTELVDMNGDGLQDRIMSYGGQLYILYNTGSGFDTSRIINGISNLKTNQTEVTASKNYVPILKMDHQYHDLLDLNGDSLPDLICLNSTQDDYQILFNNGRDFLITDNWPWIKWSFLPSYEQDALRITKIEMPYNANYINIDVWSSFSDINLDRLTDRIGKTSDLLDQCSIQLNRSHQIKESPPFMLENHNGLSEKSLINNLTRTTAIKNGKPLKQESQTLVDFLDLNGDGLPDRFNNQMVQLNCGNGFINDRDWYDPDQSNTDNGYLKRDELSFSVIDYSSDQSCNKKQFVKIIDINGDGLPDRIATWGKNRLDIQLNTGTDFVDIGSVSLPQGIELDALQFDVTKTVSIKNNNPLTQLNYSNKEMIDMDGDGLTDWVIKQYNYSANQSSYKIFFNNIDPNNKLVRVTNHQLENEITLSYSKVNLSTDPLTSKNFKKKDVLTGFTVDNINKSITHVSYLNGIFDRIENEFRGFEKVETTSYIEGSNKKMIAETIYAVNSIIGKDHYGINNQYDPYLRGQILQKTKKMQINDQSPINLEKEIKEYQKINILNQSSAVKYVALVNQYNSIFNDKGEELGQLARVTSYSWDKENGLMNSYSEYHYNDPFHTNDDIIKTTVNINNINQWLSMPVSIDKIKAVDQSLLSQTRYHYDHLENQVIQGIVTQKIEWNNSGEDSVMQMEYDSFGNICKKIESGGLTTLTDTNLIGSTELYLEIIKTLPTGLKVISRLDQNGREFEKIDEYGDKIRYSYDSYGRITSVSETVKGQLIETKKLSYSKNSGYFKGEAYYFDDIGTDKYLRMQFFRDKQGKKVQTKKEAVINGSQCWIVSGKIERDLYGRAIKQGTPTIAGLTEEGYIDSVMENARLFEYDDFSRFTQVIMPSGYTVTKNYAKIHEDNRILQVTTIKDNQNRESHEYKDLQDNIVKTAMKKIDGSLAVTTFDYELTGYQKVTEATGLVGEKQLNSLGDLIWMKSPDSGKFEYFYNKQGLVQTVRDYGRDEADFREVHYSYDQMNRIKTIDYPGQSEDITYTYYGIDEAVNPYCRANIQSIAKQNFKVEYRYDQLWIEEKKTIEEIQYTTQYEYDVQGRIIKLNYPDGESLQYTYNQGGYLYRITGSQVYVNQIEYNKWGKRSKFEAGNGTITEYQYNESEGLLDTMTVKSKDNQTLLHFEYDFDLNGNVTQIINRMNGQIKSEQNYHYDLLGRLKNASGNYQNGLSQYNRTYIFDDSDRLLSKDMEGGKKYQFSYHEFNHAIAQVTLTDNSSDLIKIDYDYDEYGNMISRKEYQGIQLLKQRDLTYDYSNRLKQITEGDLKVEFEYDTKGQRIIKQVFDPAGDVKKNIYVNGFYSVTDARIDKHISDGQSIIASRIGNTSHTLFYTSNNIGSTVMLTDQDSMPVESYLYTPYGETWIKEGQADSEINRLFTGQMLDRETGLYYFNARYYDPVIAMFITADPARDGFNHYAYCSANPINYTDPTGLAWNAINTAYIIEPGDNLWNIVNEFNSKNGTNYSYLEIAQFNFLSSPSLIYPGDVIRFPIFVLPPSFEDQDKDQVSLLDRKPSWLEREIGEPFEKDPFAKVSITDSMQQKNSPSDLAIFAGELSSASMWLNIAAAGCAISSIFLGPQMLLLASGLMAMSTAFDFGSVGLYAADALYNGNNSSWAGFSFSASSAFLGFIPGTKWYNTAMKTTTAKMASYGLAYASVSTGQYMTKSIGAIFRTSIAPSVLGTYGYTTGQLMPE